MRCVKKVCYRTVISQIMLQDVYKRQQAYVIFNIYLTHLFVPQSLTNVKLLEISGCSYTLVNRDTNTHIRTQYFNRH